MMAVVIAPGLVHLGSNWLHVPPSLHDDHPKPTLKPAPRIVFPGQSQAWHAGRVIVRMFISNSIFYYIMFYRVLSLLCIVTR
jgi:hypothetical protein